MTTAMTDGQPKTIWGHLGRDVKRAFSSRDNITPDIFRMLIFAAGVALIYVFVWSSVVHKADDPHYGGFAGAFSVVIAAGGAAIWCKRKDEPTPPPPKCE